jgi:flagellar biosynthesis GTPase FlhF
MVRRPSSSRPRPQTMCDSVRLILQWLARLSAVLLVFTAGSLSAASADKRVALVIGNSAYQHSATLENPSNDAEDLANMLTRLGFEVILEKDLSKRGMEQAFSRFARLAQDADVAMFYYAGHAMQYNGNNYLVPIDAALQDEFSVEFEMARVSDVLNSLERARGVKILVLDACRNNPLAEQLARHAANRDAFASRGLARIDHPSGMLIAYATQAGQVAEDGRGRNSPFTSALIKRLPEPGIEIAQVFRRVAFDVNAQTQGRQLPDLSMSLLGEVYLSKPDKPQITTEAEAWQKIASSADRTDFEHFVTDFPDSPFAVVAKERIRILENTHKQEVELAVLQAAREQAAKEAAALQAERAAREEADKRQAALAQHGSEAGAGQQAGQVQAERDKTAKAEAERQQAALRQQAKDQAEADRRRVEQAAREQAAAQRQQAAQQAAREQAAQQQAALDEAALQKAVREKLEQDQTAAQAEEQAAREQAAAGSTAAAQDQTGVPQTPTALSHDASNSARSSSPPQAIAALPQPAEQLPSPQDLSRSIAHELRRVGCFQGAESEAWERGPRASLRRFLQRTKLSVSADKPNERALDILRLENGKVCLPQCKRGEVIVEGACVARTCAAGAVLSRSGHCVVIARDKPKEKNRQRLASPPLLNPSPARAPRVERETTRLSRPPGAAPQNACVKWCPGDNSPCDPPYFKIADGRCSDPIH